MTLNIVIFMISLGIFMRGAMYYYCATMPMNDKTRKISFSKSKDALEYTEENHFASKAYMCLGLIHCLFTIVLLITFNSSINRTWFFMYVLFTLLMDLLIFTLVQVKVKLNKYDKGKLSEEEIENIKNKQSDIEDSYDKYGVDKAKMMTFSIKIMINNILNKLNKNNRKEGI